MPLEKIVVEKLKFSEGKTYWELKAHDFQVIGEGRFIKLPRKNIQWGFTRLCVEETA